MGLGREDYIACLEKRFGSTEPDDRTGNRRVAHGRVSGLQGTVQWQVFDVESAIDICDSPAFHFVGFGIPDDDIDEFQRRIGSFFDNSSGKPAVLGLQGDY